MNWLQRWLGDQDPPRKKPLVEQSAEFTLLERETATTPADRLPDMPPPDDRPPFGSPSESTAEVSNSPSCDETCSVNDDSHPAQPLDETTTGGPAMNLAGAGEVGLEGNPLGDTASAEATEVELSPAWFGDIVDAGVAPLAQRLDALHEAQESLKSLFESKLMSDQAQSRTFDRLHDELQHYKSQVTKQQFVPLLKDIIFCFDFVGQSLQRLEELQGLTGGSPADGIAPQTPVAETPAGAHGLKSLAAARQMLLDTLFKYDCEPIVVEGEQFDPKLQQCTRTVPTTEPSLDKKIAAVLATGFRLPDLLIRREQVSVYKFQPPSA